MHVRLNPIRSRERMPVPGDQLGVFSIVRIGANRIDISERSGLVFAWEANIGNDLEQLCGS